MLLFRQGDSSVCHVKKKKKQELKYGGDIDTIFHSQWEQVLRVLLYTAVATCQKFRINDKASDGGLSDDDFEKCGVRSNSTINQQQT